MYAPGAVLALCLCCILSGIVFGYEYGEDYQDSYYNSISNGEASKYVSFSFSCFIYKCCYNKMLIV